MSLAARTLTSVLAIGCRGQQALRSRLAPFRHRYIYRAIWLISIGASVFYLVLVLGSGVGQIERTSWQQYLRAWSIGLAVYPASVAAQALAWALGVGYLRRRQLTFDWSDVHVYASSYFLRKLPGGFWQVAGRIAAYRERGIHPGQPIAATAAELILTGSTAGSLYLAYMWLPTRGWFGGLVLAVSVTALLGVAFGQVVSAINAARSSTPTGGGGLVAGVVYTAVAELYLGAYLVAGLILVGFVRAAGYTEFSAPQAFQLWGLAAVTLTVVGFLPFLVGAREVTVTLLLTRYVDAPVAITIALLYRLLFTAGDLLWGFILLLIASRLRSPEVMSR